MLFTRHPIFYMALYNTIPVCWGGAIDPFNRKMAHWHWIAILNLERRAHWNVKFISNKWKMVHTMVCPAITLQYSLWWLVNLSDNWAFNVWTVNFIKTPTTINTQVNCNMLLLVLGSVCIVTGRNIHSHPHTRWYSQSRTFHTFLSYLYVYLSKAKYVSQSKFVWKQEF